MKDFSKLQILTLVIGAVSIALLSYSLFFNNIHMGYVASFIMRLSGCLFMAANEKTRAVYFIPVGISLVNTFNSLESLLFIELLASGVIYQVNAYLFFRKNG